jgi:hypothetical protein
MEISTFSHQVSSMDIHRGSALSTWGESVLIAHFKSTPTVLGGKHEIREDCAVCHDFF